MEGVPEDKENSESGRTPALRQQFGVIEHILPDHARTGSKIFSCYNLICHQPNVHRDISD